MTLLEPDTDGQLALEDDYVDIFDLAGDPLDAAVARLKAGVKPTAEDITPAHRGGPHRAARLRGGRRGERRT
ncbi:hypothetical protein [Streptomyces fodineus]|uniref:hypothetical protein n=1 Tax=Streptomyces fodineus TaxID=1904616 RepID=UPI001D03C6E4|nr:hypothetical protein [Streptomyces fodineus]